MAITKDRTKPQSNAISASTLAMSSQCVDKKKADVADSPPMLVPFFDGYSCVVELKSESDSLLVLNFFNFDNNEAMVGEWLHQHHGHQQHLRSSRHPYHIDRILGEIRRIQITSAGPLRNLFFSWIFQDSSIVWYSRSHTFCNTSSYIQLMLQSSSSSLNASTSKLWTSTSFSCKSWERVHSNVRRDSRERARIMQVQRKARVSYLLRYGALSTLLLDTGPQNPINAPAWHWTAKSYPTLLFLDMAMALSDFISMIQLHR